MLRTRENITFNITLQNRTKTSLISDINYSYHIKGKRKYTCIYMRINVGDLHK